MTTSVFLVLLAAHLAGDWVAQTDWQATYKTRSWAALAAPCGQLPPGHGAAAAPADPARRLASGQGAGGPDRLGRDPCRHRPALAGARAVMRAAGSPGFATVEWGVIAVDQALHLFILAMLALLLG